jgi:DNA repair protein RadC
MSIRNWPGAERPREKLLERGAHALSDAELLGLLLGSGTRGRSAVELARTLITQFGSLRTLLNAEAEHCLAQAGIGPARYAILKAALELARRHFREALRIGPTLAAPEATRTFLIAQLRDRPYEVFCCLYLYLYANLLIYNGMQLNPSRQSVISPSGVQKSAFR